MDEPGEAPAPPPGESTRCADHLAENARAYRRRVAPGAHVAVEPRLHLAVVACMDSRIDLFGLLGLDIGDAHVLRNAGGVLTDDVVRSLTISQRLLGTTEVVLVHHTDCGLQKIRDDEFLAAIEGETGQRPAWTPGGFADPFDDVRRSIRLVRQCPFLVVRDKVAGFVYDVDTHELIEVGEQGPVLGEDPTVRSR